MERTSYQNKFVDMWKVLPRIRVAIDRGLNIMFRGPTGTGKTFLVKELAKEYGKTLLVTNMTCGVGVEEIKGRYVVQPDEEGKTQVRWVDGLLVTAMKKGYWFLIEEANFMPEELASVFYSVMDDRRNIILDEHENEEVKADPEFRLFLTANWGYKGTVIPNDAIRNRIDFYADLSYLDEKEESKLIIRETELDQDIAKAICKFAAGQRKIKSRHQPDISTRIIMRWATLIKAGMNPIDAGEHTVVSLMFHDEAEKVKIRETLKFALEGIMEKFKEAKSASGEKEEEKAKAADGVEIEVGDLVTIVRGSITFYGVVTRIIITRKGAKAYAYWNEDKDKALKGIPSEYLATESADFVNKITLEAKASELKK